MTPEVRWAGRLATVMYQLTNEGETGGWASGLPPDAAVRMKDAIETYCAAAESERKEQQMERTQAEIDEQVGRAIDAQGGGSMYPGMTYEAGVQAALDWVTGHSENLPMEDE